MTDPFSPLKPAGVACPHETRRALREVMPNYRLSAEAARINARSKVLSAAADRLWPRLEGRDAPVIHPHARRRVVCRRCGLILHDFEPCAPEGDFPHQAKPHQSRALACINHGQWFRLKSPEVEPFMRKGRRRALKRRGITP